MPLTVAPICRPGSSDGRRRRSARCRTSCSCPGALDWSLSTRSRYEHQSITTRWPYHGPEVDYLEDGVNARISGDSVAEFAQTLEKVLLAATTRSAEGRLCRRVTRYSLDHMVTNFACGVIAALAAPRR